MSEARTDLTTPRAVYDRLSEIQLVDCREQYEWDAGRVEGAVHLPLNTIMSGETAGLDPGRPVVVVCRTGNRSELAALMLQARGFQAFNLEGGMEEWEHQGLPFTTPDGQPGRVA